MTARKDAERERQVRGRVHDVQIMKHRFARSHTHVEFQTANWRGIIDQSQAGCECAETETGTGGERGVLVTKSEF